MHACMHTNIHTYMHTYIQLAGRVCRRLVERPYSVHSPDSTNKQLLQIASSGVANSAVGAAVDGPAGALCSAANTGDEAGAMEQNSAVGNWRSGLRGVTAFFTFWSYFLIIFFFNQR
jgi:hypothetical protein